MKHQKPPREINGTPVYVSGSEPLHHNGEIWVTLIPDDPEDARLWEFGLRGGRTIQTKGNE